MVTIFNMAVNMLIMIYKSFGALKMAYYKIRHRYRLWKKSKELAKQHPIENNQ